VLWFEGPNDPGWRRSHAEFWLGEELVLSVSSIDVLPFEGMYVTYRNLAGEEVTYRVGDVTLVLQEEQEPHSGDPPPGPSPIYLRPTIKVALQP
jgi:hypothetical protein